MSRFVPLWEFDQFVALYPPLELMKSGVGVGARRWGDEGVAVFDFFAQAGQFVLSAMMPHVHEPFHYAAR
jgi:hypothetical protein